MTQQDLVESICMQTGISKRSLAQWIGTDHSVLCRYTSGTRTLPLHAMQQLLFLHQQIADLPPLPMATEVPAIANPAWQQRISTCEQQLKGLWEKYTTMRCQYIAAARTIQLLDALAEDAIMLTPKKERWIAEQRYQAEKLSADTNAVARQHLLMRITLLQNELAVYTALVKGEWKIPLR